MTVRDGDAQPLAELYPGLDPQSLVEVIEALGFSARDYLQTNPDLVAAGLDTMAATRHYLGGGALDECRRFNRTGAANGRAWVAAIERLPLSAPAARKLLVNLLLNRMWSGCDPLDAEEGVQRDFLLACRRKNLRPVVVIGDSHCQAYRVPHDIDGVVHIPLVMVCHGASAAGLANPHSRSGFGRQVSRWFASHAPLLDEFSLPCFFKFGQVDAEFVWAFKRAQLGETRWTIETFEAFATQALACYVQYLEQLCSTCGLAGKLRVCSIFPPTLSDVAWHAGFVNARIGRLESELERDVLSAKIRQLRIPTLSERTRLHALWNARMMMECARRGWLYVDDFQTLLGGGGVVDQAYLQGHDGTDHHLAVSVLGDVVESILARYAQVSGGVGGRG